MTINSTLDCIKLTDFEKMLLVIIKGALYDFYHSRDEKYRKGASYHITVKSTDNSKVLTSFKIEGFGNNTPKGLFNEVKKIITPFTCGFQIQGGYNEDESTTIILQRFEMKRETLNYFKAYSVTK